MDGRISPTLQQHIVSVSADMHRESAYLVVETTLPVKVIEEFRVCLASPKIQIANFEIAPD